MCKFFSLNSDGKGKVYYFDSEIRKKIIAEELNYKPDSHTSIADYFGFKGEKEDTLNKYEYNPITGEFIIDQLNTNDDSFEIKKLCQSLDFKQIVPELIIKPIIHPFRDIPPAETVTDKDIKLLKDWASVGFSVWDSLRSSARSSLKSSVGDFVWNSLKSSVGASLKSSVWDSLRASLKSSVWDSLMSSLRSSLRDSVWDFEWAYISSFFDLQEWKESNPFQSAIDLWERGLVPSFDGKDWRLHTGPDAKIVYTLEGD
ncbi:MAG: hypothetical protein ABIF11_02450 [Nitrospirota bacterium]